MTHWDQFEPIEAAAIAEATRNDLTPSQRIVIAECCLMSVSLHAVTRTINGTVIITLNDGSELCYRVEGASNSELVATFFQV